MTLARRFSSICVGVLLFASIGRADTLVLKDGRTIHGAIVEEGADSVSIRCTNDSGTITYVLDFSRDKIEEIKHGPVPANLRKDTEEENEDVEGEAPTTTQASDKDPTKPEIIPDKPKYLERAMEQWDRDHYRLAGLSFTKLIRSSTESELASLSDLAKQESSMTLAELAADAHLRYSIEHAHGRPIRLTYITSYEAEPLAAELKKLYEEALKYEVDPDNPLTLPARTSHLRLSSTSGRGDQTGSRALPGTSPRGSYRHNPGDRSRPPTRREWTVPLIISTWIDKPDEFSGNRIECRYFTTHILFTLSVLDARLKWDPKASKDEAYKKELLDARKKLVDLREAVYARSKGGLTPAEKQQRMEEVQREQQRIAEQQQRYLEYLRQKRAAEEEEGKR